MVARTPERLIAVAWGAQRPDESAYAVDLVVEAEDRPGLLRDLSELLAKEKIKVIGVQTQTQNSAQGRSVWMTFTVEVGSSARLPAVLAQMARVSDVRRARRK